MSVPFPPHPRALEDQRVGLVHVVARWHVDVVVAGRRPGSAHGGAVAEVVSAIGGFRAHGLNRHLGSRNAREGRPAPGRFNDREDGRCAATGTRGAASADRAPCAGATRAARSTACAARNTACARRAAARTRAGSARAASTGPLACCAAGRIARFACAPLVVPETVVVPLTPSEPALGFPVPPEMLPAFAAWQRAALTGHRRVCASGRVIGHELAVDVADERVARR